MQRRMRNMHHLDTKRFQMLSQCLHTSHIGFLTRSDENEIFPNNDDVPAFELHI